MALFKNKLTKTLCIIFAVIILLTSTLFIGAYASESWKPWQPNYEKQDITEILNKPSLTDADYDVLYQQTGLTKLGVDGLLENGEKSTILQIQNYFFETQDIYYNSFAPLMGYMRRKNNSYVPHAVLENGDVLFSPSTFLSFLEMGHSSMVINEITESTIQASGYGVNSNVISADNIFIRPAFVIARVKADKTVRDTVASYASNNLLGLEYDILAGIFEPKAVKNLERTHCSHIIWYAYNHFGIDIDGTGDKIVTPLDLVVGENVEIVQVYGINPKSL
ncbi:MAG: hypothetical protein J6R88_01750 [Clostridia bacterium]|nr:hypothetical protein [Clostridia bacterium]